MEEDKPPLFSRWRQWYWLVLLTLAAQIALYYWLTKMFA